ncbi:hypothetical protein [Mesorhizobium sp.]|uniref:hypothetical protein n=1 Tax=Mesorhizobium sp. TaxID=1871066 RepID=UPI0012231AA3|nr:hypothetical protein [Mesorhizobium sp.]TIS37546.1 MAG: hypothetical protein E5W95_18215 [Mesorhizobium sp.]
MPANSAQMPRPTTDYDSASSIIWKWMSGAKMTDLEMVIIDHLRAANMAQQLASAPVVRL